jgi:hypothetical protein
LSLQPCLLFVWLWVDLRNTSAAHNIWGMATEI